ncbi:unnamed protein product [Brassica oleracea var. botrytis]
MTTSPSCFAAESLTTPSLCLCRLSISKIKPERLVRRYSVFNLSRLDSRDQFYYPNSPARF